MGEFFKPTDGSCCLLRTSKKITSCEVLCGGQGGGQDTDQPCNSNLALPHEAPCKIKAPKIKRQVASVTKQSEKSRDSNKNIFLLGPTHPPKAKYSLTAPPDPPKVKYSQEVQSLSPTEHSSGRRCHRGKPHHREEGGQQENQSVKSHSLQIDNKEATRVQSGQSEQLAGTTHPPKEKYSLPHNNHYHSSHSRTTTPSQSEISANTPKCQYYQPQEDQETTSTLPSKAPPQLI